MTNRYASYLGLPLLLAASIAAPASAEVVKADADGFVTRDKATVEADTKAVWLALISPAKWWNSAHTWSGDSANMSIRPQAGGCFCERIPEDPDSEKVTFEGSVEHMRVIQAFPEKVLRMRGGLGPLQSEPATGVLTIAIGENEDGGSVIVWEYVVGGYMRYEVPVIAKAVDGVMTQQLNGLADMLGRTDAPSTPEPESEEAPAIEPEELDNTEEGTAAKSASEDRMSALEDAVEALGDE